MIVDGDFFISDWLRHRNTIEFLGIWESVHNPHFNYGEFALIKSQARLNSYKLSVTKPAARVRISAGTVHLGLTMPESAMPTSEIGRASCRERVYSSV